MDSRISCCLLIIPQRQVSTCPYSCPRNLPRCTKLGLHSAWSRIPRNSFSALSITRSTRDCNGIFLRRRDQSLWENCSRRRGGEGYRLVSSRLGVSPADYPAYQIIINSNNSVSFQNYFHLSHFKFTVEKLFFYLIINQRTEKNNGWLIIIANINFKRRFIDSIIQRKKKNNGAN